MKVLMLNGSPHEFGSTYTALNIIAEELKVLGVDSEIFHVGNKPIAGCLACLNCKKTGSKKCIMNDKVNEYLDKAKQSDGFVFGSPSYFAAASGQITSFLNRAFFAGRELLNYKPACSVVCQRRAGAGEVYDQLNRYIGINNMIQVPSKYWNMMNGRNPEEVLQDTEGVEIMRNLAKNMDWMLKMIDNAEKNGIKTPR